MADGRYVTEGGVDHILTEGGDILVTELFFEAAFGTYVLTGQPITTLKARKIVTAHGVYTTTGQSALFKRKLTVAHGVYALSGQSVLFKRKLIVAHGIYALTGQAVITLRARRIVAGQGSYLLTGQIALFKKTHAMPAAHGVYVLTGQDILTRKAKRIVVAHGVYTSTGQLVALLVNGAQILVPMEDVAAGGWLPSSGSDLYAMIDETTASDADYDYTTTASEMAVKLSPAVDPAISTGHLIEYRVRGNASNSVIVTLKQGTTTIATWTETAVPAVETLYQHTLTGLQADSITDYTDLRVHVEAAL